MGRTRSFYLDLIAERRRGMIFDCLRAGLLLLSMPYLATIALRNAYYGLFHRGVTSVGRPVISIGNVTVGGTGKTPMAAYVANLLVRRGRKVAIILRGYKGKAIQFDDERRDEAMSKHRVESDEAMVHKRLCPRADVIINPDRVAAAKKAIAGGNDAIVLDDGFQHRRLGRSADIVLVDATEPFGHGHMLPRGLLREPTRSLRRANVVVLTRSDEVDESTRGMLVATLRRISGGKPVLLASHRIVSFVDIKGRPVADADATAMRAVVFAGIGNFESFRRSVAQFGVQVLAAYEYPDHHDYTTEEIAALADVAMNLDANVLLTTEKDAVKLTGRWQEGGCRLLSPRLAIVFSDDDARLLDAAVETALQNSLK